MYNWDARRPAVSVIVGCVGVLHSLLKVAANWCSPASFPAVMVSVGRVLTLRSELLLRLLCGVLLGRVLCDAKFRCTSRCCQGCCVARYGVLRCPAVQMLCGVLLWCVLLSQLLCSMLLYCAQLLRLLFGVLLGRLLSGMFWRCAAEAGAVRRALELRVTVLLRLLSSASLRWTDCCCHG